MQVQIVTLTNSLYTEKTVLLTYMLTLFNIVFEARYFPVSWSDGFVIQLHKKKSVNDVYNYRGIALLSTLGTHFTRVLNNVYVNGRKSYNIYIYIYRRTQDLGPN